MSDLESATSSRAQRVAIGSGTSVTLPGDRGIRDAETVGLDEYMAFGIAVRQYQHAHPHTLVRTTGSFDRNTGIGRMTVRWWPRGEEEPR